LVKGAGAYHHPTVEFLRSEPVSGRVLLVASYPSPFTGLLLSHVVYRWIRRSLGELGGMYCTQLAGRTPTIEPHTHWVAANGELCCETDGDAEYVYGRYRIVGRREKWDLGCVRRWLWDC
jgi:hypothetical protein